MSGFCDLLTISTITKYRQFLVWRSNICYGYQSKFLMTKRQVEVYSPPQPDPLVQVIMALLIQSANGEERCFDAIPSSDELRDRDSFLLQDKLQVYGPTEVQTVRGASGGDCWGSRARKYDTGWRDSGLLTSRIDHVVSPVWKFICPDHQDFLDLLIEQLENQYTSLSLKKYEFYGNYSEYEVRIIPHTLIAEECAAAYRTLFPDIQPVGPSQMVQVERRPVARNL